MVNEYMPIGQPFKFEGDITKLDKNPFGFFYVKVTCPDDIMHPIIQIKFKNKTISPVGT